MGNENLDWFHRVADNLEEYLVEYFEEKDSELIGYIDEIYFGKNVLSKHPSIYLKDFGNNEEIITLFFDPYNQNFYIEEFIARIVIDEMDMLLKLIEKNLITYYDLEFEDDNFEPAEYDYLLNFNGDQSLLDSSIEKEEIEPDDINWVTEKKLSKEFKMDIPHKPDHFRFDSAQVYMQVGEIDNSVVIGRALTRNYNDEDGDNFSFGEKSLLILESDEIDGLINLLQEYKELKKEK